jgi:hypothetical protein
MRFTRSPAARRISGRVSFMWATSTSFIAGTGEKK